MTKTQRIHPVKRVITFIMALLMILSSIVYFGVQVDAVNNLVLDSGNWRGWYECHLSTNAGVATVPLYGTVYLSAPDWNPLSINENGHIVSTLKQGNPAWDDAVVVTSNKYVHPNNYWIELNIKTGIGPDGTNSYQISDAEGYGAFSIGLLTSNDIPASTCTDWYYGVNYGLRASSGYVVTFTADSGSKKYYDYYTIYKDGEILKEKSALTIKVMADGSSSTTLALVRTANNLYNFVILGANSEAQILLENQYIFENEKLYYGVGAFCSGFNLTNYSSSSAAFEITGVKSCRYSTLIKPNQLAKSGHNNKEITTDSYTVYQCQNQYCMYYNDKKYNITYDSNGGSGGPANSSIAYVCNGDPDINGSFTVPDAVPTIEADDTYEYVFAGWKSSYDEILYQPGDRVSAPGHVTMTAQWHRYRWVASGNGYDFLECEDCNDQLTNRKRIKVTFGSNGADNKVIIDGKEGTSVSYYFEGEVDSLSDAITVELPISKFSAYKKGYSFLGWFKQGEMQTVAFSFELSKNSNLYAYYSSEKTKYEITFDADGGTIKVGDDEYEADEDVTYRIEFDQPYNEVIPSMPSAYYSDGTNTKIANEWYNADHKYTLSLVDTEKFSVEEDVVFEPVWKDVYKLSFNLNGGELTDYYTEYLFFDDQSLDTVIGGFPMPEKKGYTFDHWELNNVPNDTNKWSDGWGTQPFTWGKNVEMIAVWEPNTYTITLSVPSGEGTLTPSATTYTIKYGQTYKDAFKDVFPTVTGNSQEFLGWYYEAADYTLDRSNWDTDTYAVDGDVVLTPKWRTGWIVTFDPNGEKVGLNTAGEVRTDVTGVTIKGSSTFSMEVLAQGSYSEETSTIPVPDGLDGWVFDGWVAEHNGIKYIIKTQEDWNSYVHPVDNDLDFYAEWVCPHSDYTISEWDTTSDPLRYHGKCSNCQNTGAFGYYVHFLARYDIDILLSHNVPIDELYELKEGSYTKKEKTLFEENGFVVDMLDITNSHPTIKLKFNPLVHAAKGQDGWIGWNVDLAGINGVTLTEHDDEINKDAEYTFDQSKASCTTDGSGNYTSHIRNCHLRLKANYADGYYEIVFNSGIGMTDDGATIYSCEIIDTGYQYGVLPIKNNQAYSDVMNYLPVGKQIASYTKPFSNPYQLKDNNGNPLTYTYPNKTLYCTSGWMYTKGDDSFLLRIDNFRNGELFTVAEDCYVYSYFFTEPSADGNDDGIAQGYLATMYANNKYAADGSVEFEKEMPDGIEASVYTPDYNNAYFDPKDVTGGTMYYMYTKGADDKWKCEPLFHYRPEDDKHRYDGDTVLFCDAVENPAEKNSDASKAANQVYYFIEDDFNYTNYTGEGYEDYDTIIALEPKRCSYYFAEGAYYIFPRPVNDPSGEAYEVFSGTYNVSGGGENKDPYINDALFTDENGNTYYTDIKNQNNNDAPFKLTRVKGWNYLPLSNVYTVHADWDSYSPESEDDPVEYPLGYPSGIDYGFDDADGEYKLSTGVGPNAAGQTKFYTGDGYADYGTHYGAGLELTYPDAAEHGNKLTTYTQSGSLDTDLQASYYNQWDFAVKFNANYPEDRKDSGTIGSVNASKGYVYDGSNSSDISNSILKDSDGNHYVYTYLSMFYATDMLSGDMFSCGNDYVLAGWALYDAAGNLCYKREDTLDKRNNDKINDNKGAFETDADTGEYVPLIFGTDESISQFLACTEAIGPGAEFRAVWVRVCNYTLVEGGGSDAGNSGEGGFAEISYVDPYDQYKTVNPKNTKTVKVKFGTEVTVKGITPSEGYLYAYLTLNNNLYPETADRIITNSGSYSMGDSYSFYIVDNTAMTAQFVNTKSNTAFYVDRNNKLLRNSSDAWNLSSKGPRGTRSNIRNGASYGTYLDKTTNVNVFIDKSAFVVEGYTATDKTTCYQYSLLYDSVVTVVAEPYDDNNKEFIGWKIGDGFVSYDLVYKYRVNSTYTAQNAPLKPVYGDDTDKTPSIYVKNTARFGSASAGYRYTSVLQWAAPEGYTLIEAGAIVTTNGDNSVTFDDLYYSNGTRNPDYIKLISTEQNKDGTFMVLLPYDGYSGLVYAYYLDPNKKIVTVTKNFNRAPSSS